MLIARVQLWPDGPLYDFRSYQLVLPGNTVLVRTVFGVTHGKVKTVGLIPTYEYPIKEVLGVVRGGWFRWFFPLKEIPKSNCKRCGCDLG